MPKTRKRIAAVVCAVLMTSSCMNPLAVAAVDEYGAVVAVTELSNQRKCIFGLS